MEEETEFHALVRCTHAATLRENMRASWLIPDERLLMFSGPEWLLQVIGASTKEEAGRLILILWRAWFVRNEWTHAGRWVGGDASTRFLTNYWESLEGSSLQAEGDHKGKKPVEPMRAGVDGLARTQERWNPPEDGKLKVNVDAAFTESSGEAGIGVVIRNHLGAIVLSAWKKIFGAGSAEEVEAQACREGLTLAAEWTSGPIILESDCAAIVSYLVNPTSQRSASYFVIREALEVAGRVPGVEFRHTGRACNRLAHELAQLAKRLNHSAVWRERCPTSVEHLAAQDVNI